MQGDNYNLQEKLANSDQGALGELYGLYFEKLVHFAAALVRSRELAEEVVEDVFIRLWQKRANLGEVKNLKVYLYVATKNTALNQLSKKAHELTTTPFDFLDIDMATSDTSPEQRMIAAELVHKIQSAVDALPPRCKMIFKLIREDGMKYKEVSEVLGISVNTIDAQMAIAVKRIAAAIQQELVLKSAPAKSRLVDNA